MRSALAGIRDWIVDHGGRKLFVVGPYLLVILVGVLGFRALEGQQADLKSESVSRCFDRQADRTVLRKLVELATTPSAGGGVGDLTKLDGFDELDPATQRFFENIVSGMRQATSSSDPTDPSSSTSIPPQTLKDRLLAEIPPVDC